MHKVLLLLAYLVAAAKCLDLPDTQTNQYTSFGDQTIAEEPTTIAPRTTVQEEESTTGQPLPRQVYYCTKVTVLQGQEDHLYAVDQSQPSSFQTKRYNYCRKVVILKGSSDYLYEVYQLQPQPGLGLQIEKEQERLRQEEQKRLRQEERERLRQEQLERTRQIQEDLQLRREQASLNLQIHRDQREQLREQSLIRRQMTDELRAQTSGQLQSQREQLQQTRSEYMGSRPAYLNFG